jgi:adenine-specific DNA-methyltransferase
MDNLKMHSLDGVQRNIELIGKLFPNAITEVKRNGKVEHAIDFDVLRQELSDSIVEGREERYQFTWPDKKKAMLAANAPITATLRPVVADSVGKDGTPGGFDSENLYIEGDNLEVLKLLQETYLGKVKMIYIDPPYNTGNDFVYNDEFGMRSEEWNATSGNYDEDGNQLVGKLELNTESNGRFHTDWLNMIYPRLKLAKDLLSDDGAIFISIDDNELYNLKKICDAVYGESCFVGNVAWQRTYSMRNDSKGLPSEAEHILVYSKQPNWIPNKLPRTDKMDAAYKNPDNDPNGAWQNTTPYAPGARTHQGMVYAIQHPFTGELLYPAPASCWRYDQKTMLDYMSGWCEYELKNINDEKERAEICGVDVENIRKDVKAIVLKYDLNQAKEKAKLVLNRGQWPRFYFTRDGMGGIRRKTYLNQVEGRTVTNLWPYAEVGHTDEAMKELKNLFDGSVPFDTPKPTRLVERILTIATDKDSYILDFFSGSATTAHAVMKKNMEDGGNRKYILVQLPEKGNSPQYETLCEIGKERIRRAGKQILSAGGGQLSFSETQPDQSAPIDIGFRCLRLDSSNMENVYYTPEETQQQDLFSLVDNVKPDRTPEDLLFQVMLDLGVLLSSPIEVKEIAGKKVFNVANGFLLACFDHDVTEETVKAIAQMKPYYAVFRDSSMANDSVATNFDQIFETYSPETVRKVL